jgi:hypothetical protein
MRPVFLLSRDRTFVLTVLLVLAAVAATVQAQPTGSAVAATVNVTPALVQSPTDLAAYLNVSPTGDIMLNWTAANESNVFNYVIYKTDNFTIGFNFSQPFGATPDTNFTDTTANYTDQRFYIVRTNNTFNLQDTNTFAVGKFNIKLSTGFNMVAFPLILHPSDQAGYVAYIAEGGDQLWRYDANDTLDPYKKSDYFAGFGWFGDFQMLEQERGYWYNSMRQGYTINQFNWTITGRVAPNTPARSIDIFSDFNMIGVTTLTDRDLDTFWTQPAGTDQIWRYDAFDMLDPYKKSDYFAGFGWFGDFSVLSPGRGYWYNSRNATEYLQGYQP